MAKTHEENKADVRNAVQTILNAVNGGRQSELVEAVWETVSREHRTLQQSFWSTMLLAQIKYAGNNYDLRNERAVELANKVKEMAQANNFDYGLPNY